MCLAQRLQPAVRPVGANIRHANDKNLSNAAEISDSLSEVHALVNWYQLSLFLV